MTELDQMVEVNKQARNLLAGDLHLHQLVNRVLSKQPGTDRLLLFVDQWEELYAYAKDEPAKTTASNRFIEELLAALAVEGAQLTVVLTLRADFYGEVLANRTLSDRLQASLVNLGPMTREELERAVTKPAEKVGLSFNTGLVDLLLDDVGEEPGNLPLLEFALKELWSKRRGNRLLHEVYRDMGGVKRAIAQRAQSVYESLDSTEKKTAERLFTRLVRPGAETGDTRRRAELRQLDAAAQTLVGRLAGPDARLLTTGRDTGTGQETVEVAHETLIREWGLLREWVDKVRRQLREQELMEEMARSWKEQGGGLASGRQLRNFRRAGAPTELTQAFLNASSKRVLKLWVGSDAGAVMLLGGLGGFLWWSDDLGLSNRNGAELLLYRAGLYHPSWIPEMVDIPPGHFQMGSPDPIGDYVSFYNERPRHRVTIENGFRIGRYEVTFEQFEQFCASTKRICPEDNGWGRGNRPVINVPWADVNAYIDWLKGITGREYRLPTEAEWEYATRAGSQTAWSFGDTEDETGRYAWFSRNSDRRTHPVGEKKQNPWGLYDVHGNAEEWVQDCWHDSYEGAVAPGPTNRCTSARPPAADSPASGSTASVSVLPRIPKSLCCVLITP